MKKQENSGQLVIANETIEALDQAARNGLVAQTEANQFKKMAIVAGSIQQLRALLTPKVMEPVMALQNTSIGFKTDRAPQGYPVDVVRDCLIEATLRGVFPVGNEFNIIANNCYITKEGFGHKLRDIPGLSYTITPGIPRNAKDGAGAIIKMVLDWSYNGKTQQKELELAVRVNKGMGVDAIIGKATRKARSWLFTAVTGVEIGDGEVGDPPIDVHATEVREPEASPFESPVDDQEDKNPEQDELPM